MLIGKATIEHFEECLKKGFCKEHKKELVGFDFENHEAQRKAILFLRLQVFSPLLFHKPFTFEKMRVLFQDHSFYGKSDNPESDPEFLGNIIYLDAIIVYTICHFSKICCPGILFKQRIDLSAHCTDKHLLDILQKKDIDISEISYLVPLFKENFEGKREHLYKLGYVATMLLVRNVSSRIELKSALEKLDNELNNIPSECGKWLDIGRSQMNNIKQSKKNNIKQSSEQSKRQYEEAIEAYTCGLKYSSCALNLLRDRADMYFQVGKLKEAALDSYRVLMIQPISKEVEPLCELSRASYCLSVAVHGLGLFDETLSLLEYALRVCGQNQKMRSCLLAMKNMTVEILNRMAKNTATMNGTVSNGQRETGKTTSNGGGSKAAEEKKDIPELIEASDSDLSESDEEDVPDLMEASNSEDSSSDSDDSAVDLDDNNTVAEKIDDVPKPSGETCRQPQKTWPALSNGAIHRIRNGEDVQQPVLQILSCRKMFPDNDFHRLLISDGVTCDPFALLGSELNHRVIKKKLPKFTIVRVEKYSVEKGVGGNRGLITLLNATVLVSGNEVNEKLGNPTNDSVNAIAPNNNSAVANTDNSAESIPIVTLDLDSLPIADTDGETKSIKIKRLLAEASRNLLTGNPSALQHYREALDEIKAFPEEHEYSENDIACIKYAYGTAYYKSGGYDDLLKAISTFKGIAEDRFFPFPAGFYGLALANRKLNRFKEALFNLEIVDAILQHNFSSKEYTWPESSTIIEETVTKNLKTLVADLRGECENPPNPEATCRFRDCALQTAIYYSDPDFKGFFVIQCSSHCTLQYHPNCWKLLKTEYHFSDKEFLDKNCLTPDCEGFIAKIQNIGKDGDINKAFKSAEFKKSAKKKTRVEKKLEMKEEKRRKRKDSSSKSEATSENTNDSEQSEATKDNVHLLECHSNKVDAKTEIKDRNDGPSSSKETPIYPDTFTIIKKGKILDENVNKVSSKKEHKKTRNTMSIDEFLDNHDTTYSSANDYQQRINSLQQIKENAVNKQTSNNVLKPTAPAFEPKDIRTINFAQSQASLGREDFPQMPNSVPTTETSHDTNAIATAENTSPAFNPTKLLPNEFSVECAKKNIYAYLKNILYKHGPLKEDDPILVRELQGFPVEANALIADCGGLGKFLQLSVDFAFVGDEYVCTVDQIAKAYDKKNSADIPLIPKDFSPMDGYPSYSNLEEFRGYNDSYLNPDAQEYSPGTLAKNPPHLISAISKLRQPLTVADDSTKPTEDSFCKVSEVPLDSLNCSSSLRGEAPKLPTKLQLAHKCADAVRGYFSADASDYRSFIQKFIQPYAIVEVSKKSNVLVQTDNNENENLLKSARKNDEELQRLKEVVNCLTEQNVSLKEHNDMLGEQCTLALDSVTKCKKEFTVEMLSLKKVLDDANLALEEQAKVSKSKESKLEKEIKVLNETLKKNKDEESSQKAEMSSLQATNKNLTSSLTQAEDRISLLLNEKHILKTTLDLQINKLKENVQNLETDKMKALKRAEFAELKLLEVQKISYLKIVDGKAADAVKRMKELEDGIAMHKKNLNPVYATNFFALLKQIQVYITKLAAIRTEFTNKIDEQVNSIKSGVPLEALKQLEMAELPEIPSWTSLQSMQNGTIPSAQAQFLNLNPMQIIQSALGQMPASAGYFNTPINLPPQMPIGTPRQPTFPFQNNPNQGAIPKTTTVPLPKKLPPGLADIQPEPAMAPETVSQTMPKQQQATNVPQALPKQQQATNVPQAMPKQPQATNVPHAMPKQHQATNVPQATSKQQQASNVPQTTPKKQQPVVPQTMVKEETVALPKASGSGMKSHGGSTLSLASGVSKSSIDLKKSCDSLELDYNVKKTKSKAVKQPEPGAAASSTSSKSNKKSYEKLMARLRVTYPEATQAQITAMVKDFRSEKSSLSGLTIDMIITEIIAMVEAKKKEENRKAAALVMKMQKIPNKPLVNKKLGASEDTAKEAEMNAKRGACAWGVSGDSSKQWHGKEVDEPCTICFEEMTPKTEYKVDCGHTFHRTCIQEWINKKSDCPICRVHLLLPEDYPAL
ncbi:hypothetical protein JTE90_005743 [Oedothorax gibbosus]|uniref:RING-type domain-containing protein n=1 Tax=Oedothorax gibbosus TaxID=931172 RepID=A0AAV6URT9_9ARAC|nr:hypothetical protein JTE90_005743 [Oedothorax gibbosus]